MPPVRIRSPDDTFCPGYRRLPVPVPAKMPFVRGAAACPCLLPCLPRLDAYFLRDIRMAFLSIVPRRKKDSPKAVLYRKMSFCCKLYFCRNVVAANFAAAKPLSQMPPSQMPPCIGGAKRHCSRRHPRGQSNRMFASSSSIRRRIAPLPCSFSVYQKLTETRALPCAMSNDV